MIRTFLRGAFANTAFCILAPDGETRLSRSGRSPSALFGRRGGSAGESHQVVEALQKISSNYREKGPESEAVVPDFHTTRQALNVASGDQRLLLLTVTGQQERGRAVKTLQAVLNDSDVVGRFHHDFTEKEDEPNWGELVTGEKAKSGHFIIQADSFGLEGTVLSEFPLTVEVKALKKALQEANASFAKGEERKVYRNHVQEGRRKGVHFENGMPYGEDRDGDGVIDEKRGRGRR